MKPRVTPRWPRFGSSHPLLGPWSGSASNRGLPTEMLSPLTVRHSREPPPMNRRVLPSSRDEDRLSRTSGRRTAAKVVTWRALGHPDDLLWSSPPARSPRTTKVVRGSLASGPASERAPTLGRSFTTMGDLHSISICNEHGLRALTGGSKPDAWSAALAGGDVSIEGAEATPLWCIPSACTRMFRRLGSDPSAFPSFACRLVSDWPSTLRHVAFPP
jgi:hypothetical protein